MIALIVIIIGTFLLGGYAIKKDKNQKLKKNQMRRLIYDMYYADEISKDIAGKLLDKLSQLRDKRRSRW